MKFLVLGCNGMAGHTISLYLSEQGHDVVGFSRTEPRCVNGVVGDAMDTDLIRKVVLEGRFDSVINCIGVLNQFAEENKASASFLNAYLPHFLADITSGSNTQIIHMSTDCVFSGACGEYVESDFCDGRTFYDRSKALGELNDGKNLTLRNSIIGPDLNPKGIGLMNWFLQQSGEISGYTRAIWTGQTTLQLAKTMEAAAKERAYGLINAVPDSAITKYELLKLMNHYFKHDETIINPVDGICADKSLRRTNFKFDFLIPQYDVMMAELAEWVKQHSHLYGHYVLR